MIEFEDEIYSEICGNSHTMRQMQGGIDPANPYGTLGGGIHPVAVAAGSGGVIPMGTLSAAHHYGHAAGHGPPSSTTSNQNLLIFNSGMMMNNAASGGVAHGGHHLVRSSDSASNPNSTLLRAAGGGGRASSRATMESALYSNVAGAPPAGGEGGESRPSSMLYSEAGFVRFRMGGDPGRMVDEVLRQSTDDLVGGKQEARQPPPAVEPLASRRGMGLEGLRASQSFDESVS